MMSPDIIPYTPNAGDEIRDVFLRAKSLATTSFDLVVVNFNGIPLQITMYSEVEEVITNYQAELKREAEIYRNSEAGKAFTERTHLEKVQAQEEMDRIINILPQAIEGGEAALIKWIGNFAELSDRISVNYDSSVVLKALKEAGYKRNVHIKHPSVNDNPQIFAQWLIGQVIDQLKSRRELPSVIVVYAQRYFELSNKATEDKSWTSVIGDKTGNEKGRF